MSAPEAAIKKVYQVQHRALARLLLFITGETHKQLAAFAQEAASLLAEINSAGDEWDGLKQNRALRAIEKAWDNAFTDWSSMFETLRAESVAIAFGGLVMIHQDLVLPAIKAIEAEPAALQETAVDDFVFSPQLKQILRASARRSLGDEMQLSDRLWKLNKNSLDGIKQTLYTGFAQKDSAWNIAKSLEKYLGFSADCPRWTSTRLGLTKKQIASGDLRGLKSGGACAGQGVSYNALRLARNEIQIAHGAATDQIMGQLPFVEEEQINLSPSHPEQDICDSVVSGGRGSLGIYPKGTTILPLHVQCLCFKTAVLQPPDQFTDRLRGWMQTGEGWPAMSQYQAGIGGNIASSLASSSMLASLLMWAKGGYEQMAAVL